MLIDVKEYCPELARAIRYGDQDSKVMRELSSMSTVCHWGLSEFCWLVCVLMVQHSEIIYYNFASRISNMW